MTDLQHKPLIFYAEDDMDDFESLRDALTQLTDGVELRHALHGAELIELLEGQDAAALPCLIVLDLNMPVMDGKEALAWIKSDERFQHLPIMVFTTSSREDDVKLCQTYRCTFFRKPTLYRDLLHVAQTMLDMCGEGK
jgi:CheY-like chemotaxis protein